MGRADASHTPERYKALLDAFRQHPGQKAVVAKLTGFSLKFASRTWDVGWPEYPWALPIETKLRQEKTLENHPATPAMKQAITSAREHTIAATEASARALTKLGDALETEAARLNEWDSVMGELHEWTINRVRDAIIKDEMTLGTASVLLNEHTKRMKMLAEISHTHVGARMAMSGLPQQHVHTHVTSEDVERLMRQVDEARAFAAEDRVTASNGTEIILPKETA